MFLFCFGFPQHGKRGSADSQKGQTRGDAKTPHNTQGSTTPPTKSYLPHNVNSVEAEGLCCRWSVSQWAAGRRRTWLKLDRGTLRILRQGASKAWVKSHWDHDRGGCDWKQQNPLACCHVCQERNVKPKLKGIPRRGQGENSQHTCKTWKPAGTGKWLGTGGWRIARQLTPMFLKLLGRLCLGTLNTTRRGELRCQIIMHLHRSLRESLEETPRWWDLLNWQLLS